MRLFSLPLFLNLGNWIMDHDHMKKKIEDSFAMYFLGPKDIFGWIQEICGGPILKEPSFKPELC